MAIKLLNKKNPQGVDPFKTFLVNKHERVGGNVYKRTTFQKMGPPLTRYFSQVPLYVCVASSPHNAKAVSLPYKLFGSHTLRYKFIYGFS